MRDIENEGGPAFPQEERNHDGTPYAQHFGMSLRDYFAAKALTGILCTPARIVELGGELTNGLPMPEIHARLAYAHADAMLKARTA